MTFKFSSQLRPVVVFSALLLGLLTLARIGSLVFFADSVELVAQSAFIDDLLIKGLRFDLKLLAAMLLFFFWLPVLFSSLLPSQWFSAYLDLAFKALLLCVLFLIFVDVGYLYYFQKPIDVLIFGLFEDDTQAIVSTMLDNYPLMVLFVAFLLFAYLLLRLYSRLSRQQAVTVGMGVKTQLSLWLLSLLLLTTLARGSLDTFPLQRKHASVSANTFINGMVMNSAFNLYYAFQDRAINSQDIFKRDLLALHNLDSEAMLMDKAGYSEQKPLLRVTPTNPLLTKLRPHVIFVLMEGWSSHIARQHSDTNNVLGSFANHAERDHYFTQFFANRYATNPAIEALLLNSPITPLSQSVASKVSFHLSNVRPFREQQYQTLFLSGGYSSWRNHNNFWLKQGFDRYIGRSEIEHYFDVDASDNPWGVYDEYLFAYLKHSLEQAEQQQTSLFGFVLTTNNHPPIRLPESFKMPSLDPSVYGFDKADQGKRAMLAGFHYQTDQLGQFISWVKSSDLKDRVIIVATGDHPQRTFIDNTATSQKYLRYSVPAYLYVPESLDQLKNLSGSMPGSYNDLFPTVFELSLSGAAYYAFGQPLMEKQLDTAYGWAERGAYLFDEGVADRVNGTFYHWQDQQKWLLDAKPAALSAKHQRSLRQEEYRRLLKQYLIVREYQQQAG